MKVAFATCSALPDGWIDDHDAARLLGAVFAAWDDTGVHWDAYDRVVLRSVWDYTDRIEEFLSWCDAVGPARLRNPPDLVAFNADKRYLSNLSVPAVTTTFVKAGDTIPALVGEVVVKPNISAGARDTGRFGPAAHDEAMALIERIRASGRVALVQPYLSAIDQHGETSLVFIARELSHVLRKRAVLRDDGVAPVADGPLAVAKAMLEDDLVVAGKADAAQRALASEVLAEISERFGFPLYTRVDLAADADGMPLLVELEAIEPSLYLATCPGASERFARAVIAS